MATIELRQDPSGYRFYIGGVPLHAGEPVLIDLERGDCDEDPILFHYEWAYDLDKPVLLYAPNNRCFHVPPRDFAQWEAEWPEDSVQRRQQEEDG